MEKRLNRSEVPVEQTWDLADLFASFEAWEAELIAVEAEIPNITRYKGRLVEGATYLYACLSEWEALAERFVRVSTYSYLGSAEDGTNPLNQANSARVASLAAKFAAATTFIESEVLALPEGVLDSHIRAEHGLAEYQRTLDEILEVRAHKLSPETETALAALGEVHASPYLIYQRAKLSDMTFQPIKDDAGQELPNSFALYESRYEGSDKVQIRRRAYASFVTTLKQYQNTLAGTLATEIKKNVINARLRHYESAQHMQIRPHKVPFQVYTNVLDIIQSDLAPHMRRLVRLRKRILGLDKVMYCDIEAPLDPTFNPPTTYEESAETILKALSILGPEYGKVMRAGLKERWSDLADNVGKSTGAFCSSPYGSHPYILMTWTNQMRNAFTMAHELGHAGHFALANRYQRLFNTRPTTFFIEAPSTMNELILGNYILDQTTDPRMRRWVIMQFLGTYYHNFVRHLLEGEFQRQAYDLAEQGRPLTATTLSSTKGEILDRFWQGEVEIDDGARLTWMRQPHYYMGLYPYTYAAGLTASTAVYQLIKSEGQPAVDRWLECLKAGGTMRPLELMKHAGVDMSGPNPIRKAVAYVGTLVDDLERSFS